MPASCFCWPWPTPSLLLSLIVWLLRRRGERPWTVFFGDRPPAREIAVGMASLPLIIALVVALTLAIRRFAAGRSTTCRTIRSRA